MQETVLPPKRNVNNKLAISCVFFFLLLIISYLFLTIGISMKEKRDLFKTITGMRIIVSNLELYVEKKHDYPTCNKTSELLSELNIDNDILSKYIQNSYEITYNDEAVTNDNTTILMWKSETKRSFYPESFLNKYHYEIIYNKKDGLLSKREWE